MKKAFYLVIAFSFLVLNSSCKKEVQEDVFYFPFNFYFTDKSTGENLVGDDKTKPFSPYDVSVYVINNGDPDTKQNDSENFDYYKDKEIGYVFKGTNFFSNRRDYIIHLGAKEPDTLTFLLKNGEGTKAYLNNEFIHDLADVNKSEVPLYCLVLK